MNSCINNYINGNLKDAKRQAKRFSGVALYRTLRESYGYSHPSAFAIAFYLKHPSQIRYDAACKAEFAEKDARKTLTLA